MMNRTPFRSYLSKDEQKQFTLYMKPYGITGSMFNKMYHRFDYQMQNYPSAIEDKATFWPTMLRYERFVASRYWNNYNERLEFLRKVGSELEPFFMSAYKQSAVVARKNTLEAKLSGKLTFEELKKTFPNALFSKNNSTLKIYLYNEIAEDASKNTGYHSLNCKRVKFVEYYDKQEIGKLINELIVARRERIEKLLQSVSYHEAFMKKVLADDEA